MDMMKKALESMKTRLNEFDGKLVEMNNNVQGVNERLEGMKAGMDVMKTHLCEVRELLIARDIEPSNKGKAPMELQISRTRSSSMREVSPLPPIVNEEPKHVEKAREQKKEVVNHTRVYQCEIVHHRLKLLVFVEEVLARWLFRAEQHFSVNRATEHEKMATTTICMDDKALQWYQWNSTRQPFAD